MAFRGTGAAEASPTLSPVDSSISGRIEERFALARGRDARATEWGSVVGVPMHAILVAVGSHGDVHPFVGLGLALRSRGHRVTVATNEHFASLVRRVGLEFHAIGSDEKFREGIADADVWHARRGFQTIMRWVSPLIGPVYEFIRDNYVPGETVVAASTLGFGARVAEEKLGVPTAMVHLSPAVFRSLIDPPTLPGAGFLKWLPAPLAKVFWSLGDRFMLDAKIAPVLNEYRATLGLSRRTSIFGDYIHSPRRVIGMFPEWFAAPPVDWPAQVRLAGFPLYDEKGVEPLSSELQHFLDAGDAPIGFTPGSAMVHGNEFFQTAADACVRLGRRGILLTRHVEQIPRTLPDNVKHFAYAPFSELLPRCAALVHHGGIGTTSQALRAGTAQLVMPMSHDQPDNAARVKKLGCGDVIAPSKFKPRAVAEKLDRLLREEMVAGACRGCARRFENVDALGTASKWLEEMLSSRAAVLT
jgi:rhamnosyltransferase subunit B